MNTKLLLPTMLLLSLNGLNAADAAPAQDETKIDFSAQKLQGELPEGVFQNLPKVKTIYLKDNEITGIEIGAFGEGLPSLEWIVVHRNKISRIKRGAFSNLTGLWGIILKDNEITDVEPGFLHNTRLIHYVDLSGNPIKELRTDFINGSPEGINMCRKEWHADNSEMPSVIDLTNTEITYVSEFAFRNMQKNTTVKVTGNKIDSAALAVLAKQLETAAVDGEPVKLEVL